jgi:hypothetical protein
MQRSAFDATYSGISMQRPRFAATIFELERCIWRSMQHDRDFDATFDDRCIVFPI